MAEPLDAPGKIGRKTGATLEVLDPGLFTTIQDAGRMGYQNLGVTVSGAVDPFSYTIANRLLGNPANTAQLELRFLGPVLRVKNGHVRCAVVGAPMRVVVTRAQGGEEVATGNRTFSLSPGDQIAIRNFDVGTTAYLAFDSGVRVAPVLGSASTFTRGQLGGLNGRPLAEGDMLDVGATAQSEVEDDIYLPNFDPVSSGEVRVVLGPQADAFTDEAVATFLQADWRVTNETDRMGARLAGPVLGARDGYDIISDGIATGAIQVPGSGQPIVLLADRQTTGGYPKIATVISSDLGRVAQLAPGRMLRFKAVTVSQAQKIARERVIEMDRIIASTRAVSQQGPIDAEKLRSENLVSGVWSGRDQLDVET